LAAVTLDSAPAESELLLVGTSRFPAEGGGWGLLSLSALFAASPLRFCHRRKGPSARASAPEPFAFSSFAEMAEMAGTPAFKLPFKLLLGEKN